METTVRAALAGRLGLGPSPALSLVACHGDVTVWRAARDVRAICAEGRVWAAVGLDDDEAWHAWVGSKVVVAAAPSFTTRIERWERLALLAHVRVLCPRFPRGSAPRILWQGFLRCGAALLAVGVLTAWGDQRSFLVGDGPRLLLDRALPPRVVVEIALGRWWLEGSQPGCDIRHGGSGGDGL